MRQHHLGLGPHLLRSRKVPKDMVAFSCFQPPVIEVSWVLDIWKLYEITFEFLAHHPRVYTIQYR